MPTLDNNDHDHHSQHKLGNTNNDNSFKSYLFGNGGDNTRNDFDGVCSTEGSTNVANSNNILSRNNNRNHFNNIKEVAMEVNSNHTTYFENIHNQINNQDNDDITKTNMLKESHNSISKAPNNKNYKNATSSPYKSNSKSGNSDADCTNNKMSNFNTHNSNSRQNYINKIPSTTVLSQSSTAEASNVDGIKLNNVEKNASIYSATNDASG